MSDPICKHCGEQLSKHIGVSNTCPTAVFQARPEPDNEAPPDRMICSNCRLPFVNGRILADAVYCLVCHEGLFGREPVGPQDVAPEDEGLQRENARLRERLAQMERGHAQRERVTAALARQVDAVRGLTKRDISRALWWLAGPTPYGDADRVVSLLRDTLDAAAREPVGPQEVAPVIKPDLTQVEETCHYCGCLLYPHPSLVRQGANWRAHEACSLQVELSRVAVEDARLLKAAAREPEEHGQAE